jgi:DNA-binding NarL/FixJ family response regulator
MKTDDPGNEECDLQRNPRDPIPGFQSTGPLIDPVVFQNPFSERNNPAPVSRLLSKREMAILRMVAVAKCRKEMASELNLSIHTIDTHLRHIHLKTNTHSLTELLVWALRHSL